MKGYSYFGKEYSELDILDGLKQFNGIKYKKVDNIAKVTAEYIKDGYIVGWFQGRSEFGPRALGNRSIIADPRRSDMKDVLNSRVKFREAFRPFAPAVRLDEMDQYFDLNIEAPYMLIVRDVLEEKRNIIPSVTHVDGTGRIQSVSEQSNSKFYQLITEFYSLTGVPVVLNTSFNVKGEPIVESPYDAIRCFTTTDIDVLAIGNYFVEKEGN